MRKGYALILSALLLAFSSFSMPPVLADIDYRSVLDEDMRDVQVPIPMECRVPNRSGDQCVWCSLECLSKYHKIEAGSHLTDTYKNSTDGKEVRRVLDGLSIKYTMQAEGNKDVKILEDACAKGWGASVGLSGVHMVNVVHFKGDVVKVIDNADSTLKIRTWTKDQFFKRWDGWTVILVPPNDKPSTQAPLPPRPPSSVKN
jgi:hypothetical protein